MELYKDYPRLCTIWCFIEILFYAGQLFGWSSLLYVLKQEGFYNELCTYTPIDNITIDKTYSIHSLYKNHSFVTTYASIKDVTTAAVATGVILEHGNDTEQNSYTIVDNAEHNVSDKQSMEYGNSDVGTIGCTEQDARLNLWFSTAVCVSYVMCSIMGPILQKIGMRNFRLIFLLTYILGALCLGFATPEMPWLICPGLCCIGVAGMALYSTNIHVSFLFPAVQSTITAVFVGLYDASTVVTYLMKVAFDGGIPRKYYYIGLSIIHLVLIGTSTFLFLPCIRIKPRHSNTRTGKPDGLKDKQIEKEKFIQNQDDNMKDKQTEKEKFIQKQDDSMKDKQIEKEKFIQKQDDSMKDKQIEKEKFIHKQDEERPSVCRTIFSCEYLLHVYWMCVQGLRFVSFLGFFNSWLENKFNGNTLKENYYLGVFSYVTMATAITAITAGMLHDCQRRKYMLTDDYKRRRLPIILPLTVTSLMSIIITSLTYVELEAFLNLIFILFTIYRSYLFSFEITFLNDVYPLTSFSVLFGVLHSSAGLSGLLQYPVFEWYMSYTAAPNHVNIFLMCLAASSLVHPFSLWYRCRKHQNDDNSKYLGTEIHI